MSDGHLGLLEISETERGGQGEGLEWEGKRAGVIFYHFTYKPSPKIERACTLINSLS